MCWGHVAGGIGATVFEEAEKYNSRVQRPGSIKQQREPQGRTPSHQRGKSQRDFGSV